MFFEQCAHFNALYFRNERAEQLWPILLSVLIRKLTSK